MAEPTRIRAQVTGDKARVRVLMSHEMESGQRKDAQGKRIAPWHITDITATHNGKPVLTAEWGPGVSRNPLFQFVLKGVKVGDTIAVSWKDNHGGTREDAVVVT
jgi:sulfur-oxidizing protein SoxZ